jgi:acetyl-CoA acyltransferase
MAGAAIAEAIRRAEGLDAAEVEDVLLGCAITEGTQGLNVARIAAQRAGLPETVPAQTVNRFCSSGLQTIASAAERIMAGFATTIVAGGTEHMSSTPTPTPTFSPNPEVVRGHPEYYMAMGLTGERVAECWGVSREDQDAFALRSHQRAAEAVDSGRFDPEIVSLPVRVDWVGDDGRPASREGTFERDEGPSSSRCSSRAAPSPPGTPPSAATARPRSWSWSGNGPSASGCGHWAGSWATPSAGSPLRSWASAPPWPSPRSWSSPA